MRQLPFLIAAVLSALVACGCSGGPTRDHGPVVARVGSVAITSTTLDHWIAVTSRLTPPPGEAPGFVPDAPGFSSCIARKRAEQPPPRAGEPPLSGPAFRLQCAGEYAALRSQALSQLVSAAWVRGEAAALGIEVSTAQVRRQSDRERNESLSGKDALKHYLKQSGMTSDDLLWRARTDLLVARTQAFVMGSVRVTDPEVRSYFARHGARFAVPERRDALVVRTPTLARALEARRAIEGGEPFARVAARLSIDPSAKRGGELTGLPRGVGGPFYGALFAAPKGRLVGPIRTPFGFYVLRVVRITPGRARGLAEASASVRRSLLAQAQHRALVRFGARSQRAWRARTWCAPGYGIPMCANAGAAGRPPATGGGVVILHPGVPPHNPPPSQRGPRRGSAR